MPSTPSRSASSSPEPIYTPETRRNAGSHQRTHRHSSDRLSKTRITSMLLYDERENNDLRRMLLSVTEQLKQESQRADDNERRAREAIQRFRAINEARVAAQQDATRANEELRLYKLQLEYAQKEIYKAQEILESLETQRHDAEASAAKARNVARKLREESLVDLAREEGHRLGLQAGLSRSRRLGFDHARSTSDGPSSRPVPNNLSHAEDQDDVGTFTRTSTPAVAVAEPPLDPIGETMLNFPPSPPTVGHLNAEVLSQPGLARPPPTDLQPRVVRHTQSPIQHPESVIPPDSFIPHAGNDSTIRLPPPHEMVRVVSPTSPTLNRQASVDSEPLMVRNPDVRQDVVPLEPESPVSTTISQFELVSEPNDSISRPSRRKRRSLSVIPEVVSGDNTPAGGSRSVSVDRGSPNSSASVPQGLPSISAPTSTSPTFVRINVADGSHDPSRYVYNRPSYASTSSSSARRTPVRSMRSVGRPSSLSSVPEIEIEPPSRSQSQTPQATTPYMSHGRGFLSAEDAAHRPMSPTISSPVLNPSVTPVVPQDSSVGPTGVPSQPVLALTNGQLPLGFVPNVPSLSQPSSSRMTPYSTPSAPTHGAVVSPRLSAHTDPRPLYGVPVPDASSSSGQLSSHNPVRIPLASTTADSSVMVPPASLFSQPNELSSSETDEDDAVASSLASSNDTLSTPPPSRKKPAKKPRRPTYDAAPTAPGLEYPSSPLIRASTLAPTGPPGTSAGQIRGGPAEITPASRHRTSRH
ncbi:hypothetical protein F5148DRAFT_1191375 [Russula earlei]|uniref:Uncharacterized protein n=1 Tax=Russula earlei TaxID=71964 RepID=A0ACC0UDI5_9AGAM|nr:hypothetical protein F5148DRAFT_1191375 [Russula earlei]